MKQILSVILCLLMALTMLSACKAPENDGQTTPDTPDNITDAEVTPDGNSEPKLDSPTAREVADAMNLGINLGNTFDAYDAGNCEKITYEWPPIVGKNKVEDYENLWGGGHSTKKTFEGMKEAGFDTVRIPVFWGNMMENDGSWTINKDLIKSVKKVVDDATKADMYVIVNIHHFDEFIIRRHTTEEACEIFTILWTQIAEYFKDCPYTVVFEGYNEYLGCNRFNENGELVPLDDGTAFDLTNKCNQAFVDAVRATGGKNAQRVLIASGLNTNIDRTTDERFVMPTDTVPDRLMVSVHYIDNANYWMKNIGTQDWLDYIERECYYLDKAFTSKGIPVFVGETTAKYDWDRFGEDAIHTESAECLEIMLNEIYDRGYVSVLWTAGNDYYDRVNCKMADNEEIAPHAEVIAGIAERLR